MASSETRHSRHLDLGCGGKPRNPYQRNELYGVDIGTIQSVVGCQLAQANLAVDPIPFADNYFDSVSAYDFFEHVPRLFPSSTGTRLPFIELMNEIWRVLVPGGKLYASTPAYPHETAFQDPTHVNILTRRSHVYFTRPLLQARMYGFVGDFTQIRVLLVKGGENEYEPEPETGLLARLRQRKLAKRGKLSHVIWEFEANKTAVNSAAAI